MSALIDWIKDQLKHLKERLPEIIAGIFVFALTISGIVVAVILRYLDFDGLMITFYSVITQAIGIILLYLMLKGYLKTRKEVSQLPQKRTAS